MINKAAKMAIKTISLVPRRSWCFQSVSRTFRSTTDNEAEENTVGKDQSTNRKESGHEYSMRILSTFQQNLQRQPGKETLRYHIVRLKDLLINIDLKTAEEFKSYTSTPAYSAFVDQVKENFAYFDFPGKS